MEKSRLTLSFEAEDHKLASGRAGFSTNGSKGALFDNFIYKGNPVKVLPDLDGTIYSPPLTCSRYREFYRTSNPYRMFYNEDPKNVHLYDGPNKWIYKNLVEEKIISMC